jgi:hypothetical protein
MTSYWRVSGNYIMLLRDNDHVLSRLLYQAVVCSASSQTCVFSGGLSNGDATLYLHKADEVVNNAKPPSTLARPPPLTFSFRKGLQGDAMQIKTRKKPRMLLSSALRLVGLLRRASSRYNPAVWICGSENVCTV